jgi:hypothetical protein
MKKEEILKTVKDSPASMFTKDDVCALLEKLETLESERNNIVECLRIGISERLNSHVIYDAFIENLEKDSASFSLNYDKIVLEEVDIDTYKVNKSIMSCVMDAVDEVMTDLMLHVGGSSCNGDCGHCETPCEQEQETQEDTSNTAQNDAGRLIHRGLHRHKQSITRLSKRKKLGSRLYQ